MELIASSRLHTKIVFLSVSRYLDSIGHCPDAKITVPDGGPHPTCTNILRTLDTVRARFAIWIQAAAANPTVAFQPFPTRFFSVSFVCSLRTFFLLRCCCVSISAVRHLAERNFCFRLKKQHVCTNERSLPTCVVGIFWTLTYM